MLKNIALLFTLVHLLMYQLPNYTFTLSLLWWEKRSSTKQYNLVLVK